MVRRLLSVVGFETRGLHEAAYLVALFALLSQFLGLLRDHLLAATFGAGGTLDIYYSAFRIPDFLFATIASLLSLYALLPVLSRLEEKNESLMLSFMRQILFLFFVAMGAVATVIFVFAPELIALVAPGLAHDPAVAEQVLLLTRILLLQPIFLGASNILANLTQMRHRFLLYSISPLLYNVGIIFGIVVLYPLWGIAGLAWGVVFGAGMHLLVQVPFFAAEKTKETLPFRSTLGELGKVLILSVPRTLTLAAGQISLLALVAIASFFTAGSISVFMFAYNLQAVPLTIIGVSYSIAAFPTLARLHARGEKTELIRYIEAALRHMLFWSIPATIFVIVLRAQLVRVILGAGAFNWDATRLTAAALALFVVSLVAQSLTLFIARCYYAAGNTRKPLYWGVIDVCVSVLSAVLFVELFHSSYFVRAFTEAILRVGDVPGTTVLMLALGFTIGSIVNFIVGFTFFARDFKIARAPLGRLVFQSFAASVIGGAVTYELLSLTGATGTINTTIGLLLQGSVAGVVGILTTAFVLSLLKNQELAEALSAFRRRFKDAGSVALEPTDIAS